jgi:hypothetical protein
VRSVALETPVELKKLKMKKFRIAILRVLWAGLSVVFLLAPSSLLCAVSWASPRQDRG